MSSDSTGLRRVPAAGLTLAVREHTSWAPGKQSVILVHGYPDRQQVWDPLVAALPQDDLHIVTYDVRGAGLSDVPTDRADYRTERLVEDLTAVIEAVVPEGESVHLVGHDWGSVQLWDAVDAKRGDPRALPRIASFTSISGPSLDHVARIPRKGNARQLLRQQLHSYYILLFLTPAVPELMWRRGHRLISRAASRAERAEQHWGPGLVDDAVHGLALYRANIARRMRRPGRLRTDVPVLVVHPTHDPYITGFVHEGLERECGDVHRVDLEAGHWAVRSHPTEVASLVAQHITDHRADHRPDHRPDHQH